MHTIIPVISVVKGRLLPYIALLVLLIGPSSKSFAQTATLLKGVDLTTASSGENLKYSLTYGCSSLDADCIGAMLIDTLPPEVTFQSATQAIIAGSAGLFVISPIYNDTSHTVIWDFTTILPEGGLPDGSSGTVEVLVTIQEGVTPDGIEVFNEALLPTDNAGTPIDSAITTVEGVSPKWSLTKTVTSGPIYHDKPVTYEVAVCPDSPIGNLHLLPGAVVRDTLPPGAVFTSASNGGIHDGGTPGSVTWTISDTLRVTDPCRVFNITVEYPENDPNNQTGLDTPIPKLNKADLTATAIGNIPVTDEDTVNNPLLPPVFMVGVSKETGNGNGATPIGTTNKFIIAASNNSTTSIDSLKIVDVIPPQADITEIHIEPSSQDTVFASIRVQLNNSGTWINFQTGVSTASETEFDVTTIPGWDAMTSYVSHVEVNFGTVNEGFRGELQLIFEPAYPTANDGTTSELDTAYSNGADITYIRPLDNMLFTEPVSTPFCIVNGLAARIDPDKAVEINYVDTPAGDPTTGNPYFKGARVKYTLHIGNDGFDGSDDDDEITADSSFTAISDPIGADLLPPQMLYETNSWTIVNNTSDEVWDNSGTNPTFELIDDFNGSGKTLLRWTFTGDLDPGESLDICFNAFIQDTVTTGRVVDNGFAMTSAVDLYCDTGDCETVEDNPELYDYFGQSGDPSMLLPGITEMCEQNISFIVADSTSVPTPTKSATSPGPYAPAESAPALLGLAMDTVTYNIGFCNEQSANYTLPDPVLMDLLPEELSLVPGSVTLIDNTTGLPFVTNPNGGTNPIFEVIDDFAGTGRQLLRWTFIGEVPINKCVEYSFRTLIKEGSGGLVANEPYIAPASRFFECAHGGLTDSLDMDNDGLTLIDTICAAIASADILIPSIQSMGAKKFVKGAKDAEFLGSDLGTLGVGCTYPGDSVLWRFRIFNPGNVTLTDAVVVDIFPHIGDKGVQLTSVDRETEWVPYLVEPIAAPKPSIEVYYSESTNPCRTAIEPEDETGCVNDWTTTPPANLADVKAVMFDFANEDIDPAEEFWFEIKMLAPDSIDVSPGIAWNSMARNSNEVPAQEPNKVGVVIEGYDMALRKQLRSGQPLYVEPGEDVEFAITLVNQSTDSVKNITITDYIPPLFTLNDTDWTSVNDSTATLIFPGPMAPNDSLNVYITLTVDPMAMTGDFLDNFAEITDFQNMADLHPDDWDSQPDSDRNNDAGGTINSPADDVTAGNGRGTVPGTDAATDEDDHDGARIIICPGFVQNVAPDQEVCTDNLAARQDIKIPTTADAGQNVKFVYYTSRQTDTLMYNGLGTDLQTVNPVMDTVTLSAADMPTTVGTYYIYAILDPTPISPDCRPFDEVVLIINPPIDADAGADVEICEGENTDLTAAATGGNGDYFYLWSTSETSATINVSPVSTTDYIVTITDSSTNCSDTDTVTIIVNPLPMLDAGMDIDTCINALTTLIAQPTGGTPGYTFLWSQDSTTASIMVALENPASYTVTVTDSKGCQATDGVAVNVPVAAINAPITTVCQHESTTITASGGVSYEWSSGDMTAAATVTPLVTTMFYVTVTDAKNCTDVDSVLINVNPLPVYVARDTSICLGESVNLTSLVVDYNNINNPAWSADSVGGTAVANPNLVSPADTIVYVLIGEDNNGCRDTVTLTVDVTPLPILATSPDTTICLGTAASISASATSGTPAFVFSWDNSLPDGDNHTVMPTVTTTYNVLVTDAQGCTDNGSIAVTVTEPVANAGPDLEICLGDTATITASGGGTYLWNTGDTSTSIEEHPPVDTNYSVTVTDAFGCTDADTMLLTVHPLPVFTARDTAACLNQDVDLTTLIVDYVNIQNPQWFEEVVNGTAVSNPNLVSPPDTLNYILVGEDINTCKDTVQLALAVLELPIVTMSADTTICLGSTVPISAMATGKVSSYTYTWNNGLPNGNMHTVSPSTNTAYRATATDDDGCQQTGTTRVNITNPVCLPIQITIKKQAN